MNPFNRRDFLQRSAILSAATGMGTALTAAEPKAEAARKGSAGDRIRVAVVGVRGRGMSHVGGLVGGKKNTALNTEITHVCDCDSAVIAPAMKEVEKQQGAAPTYVQDFRKLLDNKDIDVITIATPNHWHALMAVWAMRAGKDVYCEKPATHNVREGRIMVDTARKHNRICQVGTQSRSTAGMRAAQQYIRDGHIGKVSISYGTCYKRRKSIGKVTAPTAPPATIDYDLWCGPAPKLPVNRKSLHYDWHWVWEYGNGDLGNQGVHEMDKARWGLGDRGLPLSVVSVGGRFGYVDDGQTANTQLALFDYGDAHVIFEVRGLETDNPFPGGVQKNGKKGDNYVGNIYYGDKGVVVCPSYSGGVALDPDGKVVREFKGGGDEGHFANFVKAVRSRNVADLNCDVEVGHQSAALCHLANISYRLGTETPFDADIKSFSDCKEATEALARMKQHLTENGVDLKTAVGRVGPKLTVDAKTERFAGNNEKANQMLFREYRKGFDILEGA
jgi:predicted dehydrogenase